MDDLQLQKFKERIRNKLSEMRTEKSKRHPPDPPPRYDDVFWNGVPDATKSADSRDLKFYKIALYVVNGLLGVLLLVAVVAVVVATMLEPVIALAIFIFILSDSLLWVRRELKDEIAPEKLDKPP